MKLAIELSEKMDASKPAHMAAFLKVSSTLDAWGLWPCSPSLCHSVMYCSRRGWPACACLQDSIMVKVAEWSRPDRDSR